jgi:amidohydrolase
MKSVLTAAFPTWALACCFLFLPSALAQPFSFIEERTKEQLPYLLEVYRHLHAHPELSLQEQNTARRLADELQQAGFEVASNLGGHGVVGVLRHGSGPTVLVRADMDALPVQEQTGLPYASKLKQMDGEGREVPVMHACGHDIHMTCLVGAARVLSQLKDQWHGTLVFIAQPAEEIGAGAKAMIGDGLFERFPVPDYAIALHVSPDMPAGTIGYTEGFALANVDSVDLTIRGIGGHGAYPQSARDPVVLAAQTVLALQTIVSREIPATDPAVITVGSIQGGTKHNIIPGEVHLQLTLRSYSMAVREQMLQSIQRISRGLALAAGLPEERMPLMRVREDFTPALYNDPELTRRLMHVFRAWLGEGKIIPRLPRMGGEDFGRYGLTEHRIPICMFSLGSISPERISQSLRAGQPLPALHSPFYAPDPEPAIQTGVSAFTLAVLELLRQD